MRRTLALWLALIASAASGADVDSFERILLPIMVHDVAGVFGSRWHSEFAAHNASSERIRFTIEGFDCPIAQCALLGLRPNESYNAPPWRVSLSGQSPGVLVYAEKPYASEVSMSLKLRETSRGGAGIDIPVIRERDFRKGVIRLVNVPITANSRQTLRIYDPYVRDDSRVLVRFYAHPGTTGPPVAAIILRLATERNNLFDTGWHYHPRYAELFWIAREIPQLANFDAIRIEIEPLTPGLRYWAFVSVTDNETQQPTIITPEN